MKLQRELFEIHNVFHVIAISSHVLPYHPLDVQEDDTYVEQLVRTMDTKEQVLRTKTIHWVKVQWEHHNECEASWELWNQVKNDYPHLLLEVCLV